MVVVKDHQDSLGIETVDSGIFLLFKNMPVETDNTPPDNINIALAREPVLDRTSC